MALKKKPVTGMKDILPREMEIRSYVMNLIRETYATFGFSSIETPCVEHIESKRCLIFFGTIRNNNYGKQFNS